MHIGRYFSLLLLGGMCCAQPLMALEIAESDLFKFGGRLHVVVLHLPIGILLLGILASILRLIRVPLFDDRSLLAILVCGSVSAMFAVCTGLMLAQEDSELSSSIQWHMYTGIAVFGVSLLNVFLLRRSILSPVGLNKALFYISMLLCAGLVSWSGHLGGNLTHPNFVDKYAPWSVTKSSAVKPAEIHESDEHDPAAAAIAETTVETTTEAATATSTPESIMEIPATSTAITKTAEQPTPDPMMGTPDANVMNGSSVPVAQTNPVSDKRTQNAALYVSQVEPLLAARCYECHGSGKRKGELRLDTPDFIRKGGKNGAVVVAGQPEHSSIYTLCILDPDDPDIMPSSGDALTKAETDLIQRWILGGAYFENGTGAGKAAPVAEQPVRVSVIETQSQGLQKPDPQLIKRLTDKGILVNPLSSNGALLELDMRYVQGEISELKDVFAGLAPHVCWLDAGRSKLDDQNLALLMTFTKLQRLYVHQTKITDLSLKQIGGLKDLEVLNLYKCDVSDAGLKELHRLKSLNKIYLWQTKVTDQGVKALQKALPTLEINRGV